MRIQVLPQTLINQIAAGEVVVRMASVVKELLENSIDAGASRIDISISKDARDVEIKDDGCGMSQEDAELCLQRHATSKISKVDDLMNLQTRGFRGEAVPSIASVSRMEIQTRAQGALSGTRVVVEGGRIMKIEPFGCPAGTRFIIRELFYNTPARLKFLKSPVGEANAILTLVSRHAIAVPQVGFHVTKDGREVLNLPSRQSLEERFAGVLGSHIKRPLLFTQHEREGVSVQGYLAHPLDARSDRRSQFFYVNGRPFSSKTLSASMEQACRGFVMIGRFPIAALFIDVPPGDVDINVHPTKEEVRFEDERNIAGAIYRAIQNSLEGNNALIGDVTFEDGNPQRQPAGEPTREEADGPSIATAPPPPGFFTNPELLIRRAFEKKQGREEQQSDWVAQSEKFERFRQRPEFSGPERIVKSPHGDGTLIAAGPGEQPDHDFWARGYEPEPLGQIAETYILARFGEDLLVIDQHASHERIRYLELLDDVNKVASQRLLVPITMEVTPTQHEVLQDLQSHLLDLGIDVCEFGPRTWAIEGLPTDLSVIDPVPLLLQLIDDFEDSKKHHALEDFRDKVLIRRACHSAIRAGEQLPMVKMQELLKQIKAERLSLTCPHGRPTILKLSKHDLDKQFKRIV